MQSKIILDTNVYGELLIEKNREELVEKIKTAKRLFIYGIDVIEMELNKAPKDVTYKGEFFRDALITLFKTLIDEEIKVTPLAKDLANQYFRKYNQLKDSGRFYKIIKEKIKKYAQKDLEIDFEIIAIASLNSIDIIVSEDKRTMLSILSKEVYKIVNEENKLRTPELIEYKKFKEDYLK